MITKKLNFKKLFINTSVPENHKQLMKDRLRLIAMIAGIYVLFLLLRIGCPIKFLSGIPCPGCGMTRACIAALRFDFVDALYFHPLFFLAPVILLLFLFDLYIKERLKKILWVMIIIAFLTVYLIRLFITNSAVVIIDIPSAIMIKLYQLILGGR